MKIWRETLLYQHACSIDLENDMNYILPVGCTADTIWENDMTVIKAADAAQAWISFGVAASAKDDDDNDSVEICLLAAA